MPQCYAFRPGWGCSEPISPTVGDGLPWQRDQGYCRSAGAADDHRRSEPSGRRELTPLVRRRTEDASAALAAHGPRHSAGNDMLNALARRVKRSLNDASRCSPPARTSERALTSRRGGIPYGAVDATCVALNRARPQRGGRVAPRAPGTSCSHHAAPSHAAPHCSSRPPPRQAARVAVARDAVGGSPHLLPSSRAERSIDDDQSFRLQGMGAKHARVAFAESRSAAVAPLARPSSL